MPTTLNTKPEPNISSGKQRRNHALRKSRSVGGDIISSNNASRNITASPSLEVHAEEDNNGVGECSNIQLKSGTPCSGLLGRKSKSNASGKKGIGNIFKWFKQDRSNSFDIPSDQKDTIDMKSSERKGTIPRGHDLISLTTNGLKNHLSDKNMNSNGSKNGQLSSAESVDSLCSLASTASFAYMSIGKSFGGQRKEIPMGLACGKETYQKRINRQQSHRKENVNLSTKYQLLPADYSPPTLRRKGLENFSAISGPALPSGPHLPNSEGITNYSDLSDDDMGSDSTLSDVESIGMSNYSAVSPLPLRNELAPIKPKERKGEMSKAISLAQIKNPLEEIGWKDNDSKEATPAVTSDNPFESDIDDDTLKHSSNKKGNTLPTDPTNTSRLNDDASDDDSVSMEQVETLSTAPTALIGLDPNRLEEVKIYSHIPGKRKAPEPPKRNGGAYYARIAKAMSPKISRPNAMQNLSKSAPNNDVKSDELNKPTSPSITTAGASLSVPFHSQQPEIKTNQKINDITTSDSLKGALMPSSDLSNQSVQKDLTKETPSHEINPKERSRLLSLKSSSPLAIRSRGIEKSFSEKSIYAQYCSSNNSNVTNSKEKDEEIYEFVKTKSPSPSMPIKSPKPWYKKPIGIFDKSKRANNNKSPLFPSPSNKSNDNSPKAVLNASQSENVPHRQTNMDMKAFKNLDFTEKSSNVVAPQATSNSPLKRSNTKNAVFDKSTNNTPETGNVNPTRPVSLLMSISDFDRQAAEIVSQRQKQEEAKQRALNDAFYVSADNKISGVKSGEITNSTINETQKEPQEMIDEIMANVEKKMEHLDEIEKHNDKWVNRMSANMDEVKGNKHISDIPIGNTSANERAIKANESSKDKSTTSMDMKDLVSDLNSFLNTTQRELRTPKGKRKQVAENTNAEKLFATKEQGSNQSKKEINPYAKLVQSKSEDVEWACVKCTLINAKTARICTLCGASRDLPIDFNAKEEKETNKVPEMNIFEAPEIDEEAMPAKGNVLDRVVQFTALQMCSAEKPQFATKVWIPTEFTAAEGKQPEVEDRASTAKISKTNTVIKDRSPKLDEAIMNEKERIKTADRSLLEKEERDAILARWKKEHDERVKAREAHFRNRAQEPAPQADILKEQAELLMEANRKLEEKLRKEEQEQLRKQQMKNMAKQDGANISSEAKITVLAKMEEPVKDDLRQRAKEASVKKLNNSHLDSSRNNLGLKTTDETDHGKKLFDATNSKLQGSNSFKQKSNESFGLKMPSQFIDKKIHTNTLSPTGTLSDTLRKAMQLTSSEDSSDHEVIMSPEELRKVRLAYYEKSETKETRNEKPQTNNSEHMRNCVAINTSKDSVKESRIIQIRKSNEEENEPHYKIPINPPKRVPDEFFQHQRLQFLDENVKDIPQTHEIINYNAQETYEPIYSEIVPKALRKGKNSPPINSEQNAEKGREPHKKFENEINKINEFKANMAPIQQNGHVHAPNHGGKDIKANQELPSYTNMEDARAIMAIEGLKLSKQANNHKASSGTPKRPMRQKVKKSVSLDLNSQFSPSPLKQNGISGKQGSSNLNHMPIPEERKLSIDSSITNGVLNDRAMTTTPQPFNGGINKAERARTVTPQPLVRANPYSKRQLTPVLDNRNSFSTVNGTSEIPNINNKLKEDANATKRWSNCSFPDPLYEENNLSSSSSSLSYKTAPYYAEIPELPKLSSPIPFNQKYHGWSNEQNDSKNHRSSSQVIQDKNNKTKSQPKSVVDEMIRRQKDPQSGPKNNQVRPKSNSEIQMLIETRRNNMEAEKMEEALLVQNSSNMQSNNVNKGQNEIDSPDKFKKMDASQTSKIPVPIKDKHKKSEKSEESTIEKERLRGAIRKQPKKNAPNFKEKKPNIPTKINHKSFSSPQIPENRIENPHDSNRFSNISSGDIIDDVLYISTPIKSQNLASSNCVNNQNPSSKMSNNQNPDSHLQGFHLIAPDNFMNYKAVSVNDNNDSTKVIVANASGLNKSSAKTKVLNNDMSQDNRSDNKSESRNKLNSKNIIESPSSLKQHSLEEVDSSAIRNGNRAFVQNDARGINHGQPSRSNGRQFNSESNLRPNESNNNQNGVGDIMTRLENAIASGNHKEAALLAKEVSKLQISTKLAQKELSKNPKIGPPKQEKINLQMFVEDKTSYNGPISIRVSPKLTVEELKDYINCEFEIPIGVQKWILGKSLVEDEKTTLISHGISKNGQKVFLYLVAPEADKTENTSTENKSQKENNASSESSSAASGEASATETKSNLPPPPDPNRKGRYWNYEMNRWSYCSSDDDDEDEDKPQKGEPEKEVKELKEEIKNAETVNIELQKVEIARENPKPLEDIKEGDTSDYEWEYFYEDVEVKPKADNDEKNKEDLTKSPVPKRLEPLVKPSTSAEANVGTVVNEGATRIIKDAPIPSKEQSAPQPGPSGKTQRVDPRDGWECPSCTFLNEPKRPGCEICTTERPADYVIPPPGPADTIPRNSSISGGKQPVAAGNVKNDNKEPPTLKVVAATVTKAEPPAKAPGAVGGKEKSDQLSNYKKLDDLDIIPNSEEFECLVCFLDIEPGDGVVLRECLHTFCKECLSGAIEHSDAPAVTCPYKDDKYSCDMKLLEREIKALVSPAVFEKHQQKSLKEVQATSKNSFHCKTPDCEGWCFISDNINSFKCPLCKRLNCITCQAIHEGQDCKQYQRAMLNESQDENSIKTKKWIEGLINTGEALNCPSCQVILLKKWGCDWVRCTYCRTEICWVTKQLRWGPNGKGDTSAGCRCMADGRTKCHPLCNYCH